METIATPVPIAENPTLSDTEKARQLKRQNPNMTAKEIADHIGRKVTYVYAALRFAKDIPHPKRGRPRKTKKAILPKTREVINKIKAHNVNPFQEALKDSHIAGLEREVADLKTVIRYLEGRLYGPSV